MRVVTFAALLLCLAAQPASAADFAAAYDVTGTSPGGGAPYQGVVTLKKTGEATYEVIWVIAGETAMGTGIGSPAGLAVGYKLGASNGVAIYSRGAGGVVEGYWTYSGGKQIGQEIWKPR